MIVFTPIVALALTAQSAPPPAPPAPPQPVADVPGYVSRCTMITGGDKPRTFAVTLTVTAAKGQRKAKIVSEAKDILPSGSYHTRGAVRGGFMMTSKRMNEVLVSKSGVVATSGWSSQDGTGVLVVSPRMGTRDTRTVDGTCRIAWSAA